MRSTPGNVSSGNDTPTSTRMLAPSHRSQRTFFPNSPTPPRGTISSAPFGATSERTLNARAPAPGEEEEIVEGQLFRSGAGRLAELGQRLFPSGPRRRRRERVRERLAPCIEAERRERQRATQLIGRGVHLSRRELEDARDHLRPRTEGPRRQIEEDPSLGESGGADGQVAVALLSRPRDEAARDFALHGRDRAPDPAPRLESGEQDRRRGVVGKVRHEERAARAARGVEPARDGPAQNVALEDPDPRLRRVLGGQRFRPERIDLDGRDRARRHREDPRERAVSGADLEHAVFGTDAGGFDDAAGGFGTRQEVLPPALAGRNPRPRRPGLFLTAQGCLIPLKAASFRSRLPRSHRSLLML